MIMKRLKCVILLLFGCWTCAHSQTLVGEWKPIVAQQFSDTLNVDTRQGDWIFYKDLSFAMVGADSKKWGTVVNWHAGATRTGKWRIKQIERLELRYEDFATMTMTYEIVKLNKNELYLRYYVPSYLPHTYVLKFKRVSPSL